jgi:hypothetical protein
MASNPHIITLEEGWDNQIKKKVRTAGGGGGAVGGGICFCPARSRGFCTGAYVGVGGWTVVDYMDPF